MLSVSGMSIARVVVEKFIGGQVNALKSELNLILAIHRNLHLVITFKENSDKNPHSFSIGHVSLKFPRSKEQEKLYWY